MNNKAVGNFLGAMKAKISGASYPDQILTNSGEALPVSKGGIVLLNDPQDLLLLPKSGITTAEIDRDLGEGFYEAASNADMQTVALLTAFFNDIDSYEGKPKREFGYSARELMSDYERVIEKYQKMDMRDDQRILIDQAASDVLEYYPVLAQLRRKVVPATELEGIFAYGGFSLTNLDDDNQPKEPDFRMHVDVAVNIRGFFGYVGKMSSFIDDRVTKDEMNKLITGFPEIDQDIQFTAQLTDKYGTYQPKVGNPYFFNGYMLDEKNKHPEQAAINNVSIHSESERELEDPKHIYTLDL
tara:strand:- start:1773 stop:2669 length:897 start_codon:yes stop_codon:yes gene_type:complete